MTGLKWIGSLVADDGRDRLKTIGERKNWRGGSASWLRLLAPPLRVTAGWPGSAMPPASAADWATSRVFLAGRKRGRGADRAGSRPQPAPRQDRFILVIVAATSTEGGWYGWC